MRGVKEYNREKKEEQDRKDFELILEAYKMHGYTKGARGIQMALLHFEPSIIMNLKKIRRLKTNPSLLPNQSKLLIVLKFGTYLTIF